MKNDEKILELKKKIEEKKVNLTKSEKFSPITNCSIEVDGIRYNINVLNKEQLKLLLVKLNMYLISIRDLKLEFGLCGFKIEDWMEDVKNKLNIISRKEEENNLRVMENKLTELLSNDKKVELEIESIEMLLK